MVEFPKLRPVEAFPTELNGRQVLCLRDPTHYAEVVLFVPLAAVEILRHFDGTHSVLDIQADYARRHGALLFREEVEDLIATLDQHYFLDSDRFAKYHEELREGFRRAPTRAAFLAGKSYPADPELLRRTLDEILDHPEGPTATIGAHPEPIRALIAPHIDFMRGAAGYAWAYQGLVERTGASVFVVLGTAHAGTSSPFAACAKDFETPLGVAQTDRDLLRELERRCPQLLAVDDIAHRAEHSIEFQVLFLQHLLGPTRSLRILPILCGSFHEWILSGRVPSGDPPVREFLDTLHDLLETRGDEICLVAGADLAHVGARFGDSDGITPDFLRWIESQDRQMLEPVAAGNPEGFFRFVSREGDRRRICGLPPIYTLLTVIRGHTGRLLHYGQAPDPQGAVTFCAMAFPA